MYKESKKQIFLKKAEKRIEFFQKRIVQCLKIGDNKGLKHFSKLLFILRDKTLELSISKRP